MTLNVLLKSITIKVKKNRSLKARFVICSESAVMLGLSYLWCDVTQHVKRTGFLLRPSATEGQTANILISRTGLRARCSTSLLKFEKYLMSLLAETKRRVTPATKFKFFKNDFIAEN